MKLAACDFCDPKGELPIQGLKTITINNIEYDICETCQSSLMTKLAGKGTCRGNRELLDYRTPRRDPFDLREPPFRGWPRLKSVC